MKLTESQVTEQGVQEDHAAHRKLTESEIVIIPGLKGLLYHLDSLARYSVLFARSFSSLKQDCLLPNICCCTLKYKDSIPRRAACSAHSFLFFF